MRQQDVPNRSVLTRGLSAALVGTPVDTSGSAPRHSHGGWLAGWHGGMVDGWLACMVAWWHAGMLAGMGAWRLASWPLRVSKRGVARTQREQQILASLSGHFFVVRF